MFALSVDAPRFLKRWKSDVLYPFGHGLSYTTFTYANIRVSPASAPPFRDGNNSAVACDTLRVSVDVSNSGGRDGDEVVQLYLQLPDATVRTTRVRLVGFDRVFLRAGSTRTVTLLVSPRAVAVVHGGSDIYADMRHVEAGRRLLFAGGGQPDYVSALSAEVRIGNTKALAACM